MKLSSKKQYLHLLLNIISYVKNVIIVTEALKSTQVETTSVVPLYRLCTYFKTYSKREDLNYSVHILCFIRGKRI